MKISKSNICQNPNYNYYDGFFIDKDSYYNFVRCFKQAKINLDLASLYAKMNSDLDKKIDEIIKLMGEIEIKD